YEGYSTVTIIKLYRLSFVLLLRPCQEHSFSAGIVAAYLSAGSPFRVSLLLLYRAAFRDLCFELAASGLGRSPAKNSSTGSVLRTSAFSSQPRRAIVTPCLIYARFPVLCESVEITTFTPRCLHIRK